MRTITEVKTGILLFIIILLAGILRLYAIDSVPHGLYIDEVSIGQNAYTILQSGKDEYGKSFPFFFQAFGEYKLPVYIYLTSLSMAILGKTELAVRFPSVVFGTATVVVFYFLLKLLLSFDTKQISTASKKVIPLLGAFLLAIAPWHLQFSRGGFEVTVALFFYLLGLYFLLNGYKKEKALYFFMGTVSLILTMYTYSSFRLLAPITLLPAYGIAFYKYPKYRYRLIAVIISNLVLLLPIIIFTFSSSGGARFNEVSAFDTGPLPLYQKLLTYPAIYILNYLSFFSSTFLFVSGDGIGRHTVKSIGPLFRWEFIALLIGALVAFKNRRSLFTKLLFFLTVVSPLAAALTLPSPHLLRSFLLVIPITALVALGITKVITLKPTFRYPLLGIFLIIAVFEFSQYLHLYYVHYPAITALDWGSEYKEMIYATSSLQKKYPKIYINSSVGNVQEYIKFYRSDLPYTIVDSTWKKPDGLSNKKVLFVTTPDPRKNKNLQNMPRHLLTNIHAKNLNDDIVFQLWEI